MPAYCEHANDTGDIALQLFSATVNSFPVVTIGNEEQYGKLFVDKAFIFIFRVSFLLVYFNEK